MFSNLSPKQFSLSALFTVHKATDISQSPHTPIGTLHSGYMSIRQTNNPRPLTTVTHTPNQNKPEEETPPNTT